MSNFFKVLFFGPLYLTLNLLSFTQLSAYVSIPRSTADTTDRMNTFGDVPDRPGLRDIQRSPEYLDDWWGKNDYYYSYHGRRYTGGSQHQPEYDLHRPPYYPLPNTSYNEDIPKPPHSHYSPDIRSYQSNNGYYHSVPHSYYNPNRMYYQYDNRYYRLPPNSYYNQNER